MWILSLLLACLPAPFMNNPYGRDTMSLNGEWNIIADILDKGERMRFYEDAKPVGKTDFYEYSFSGGETLRVPGDWNHQSPEWKYYEGTIWYGRHFNASVREDSRQFIWFGGVSYRCKVYLNGKCLGAHEGSFLPFQMEVTGVLRDGDNFLCVQVNNRRQEDAIPALDFDWWNYGGITRDVLLVRTPKLFVNDWYLRLNPVDDSLIDVNISLSDPVSTDVILEIPELKVSQTLRTGADGCAGCTLRPRNLKLWNPGAPVLYKVRICAGGDKVEDVVGFRRIEVRGTGIFVNGKRFFAKSVSFHEEIPQRQGRACTPADAEYLVGEAVKLGVNMVRLAHYPQNGHIVRLAERKGIVLWEEIPLWQKIKFSDEGTYLKAEKMYTDMLFRDRNRCNVCFWGLANETRPSESRNAFLTRLQNAARAVDDSRLFTLADDVARYNEKTACMELNDPLIDKVDVAAINRYFGWYHPWPVKPSELKWNVAPGKPLIISEFGGESLKGVYGDADVLSSWSEDSQLQLYRDNLSAFANIPNLAGISPWVLFDFRSPRRFLPARQDGWNRKGLISDKGEYKKAWYLMKDFYSKPSPLPVAD